MGKNVKRSPRYLSNQEYTQWKIANKKPRSKKQIKAMMNDPKLTFYMLEGQITTKNVYGINWDKTVFSPLYLFGQAGNQEPEEETRPPSPIRIV